MCIDFNMKDTTEGGTIKALMKIVNKVAYTQEEITPIERAIFTCYSEGLATEDMAEEYEAMKRVIEAAQRWCNNPYFTPAISELNESVEEYEASL